MDLEILAVLLCLLTSVKGQGQGQVLPDSFQRWTQELSLETGMEVKWNAEDPYYLTMEISAPTLGYVAVGFSPSGGMKGSDIVVGWVDRDGLPHLADFHAPKREQPIQDDQQDYDLVAASERDGRTTVRFRRRWDTCDDRHDLRIDGDTVRLIWAWHLNDPLILPTLTFHWHGAKTRGTRTVLLRSPVNTVRFPNKAEQDSESIRHWDVAMSRVHIEPIETTYMCRIFKFPRSDKKFHLIGFRPLILKAENIEFVHHITLYTCHVPDHFGGTRNVFEKYVGTEAAECYDPRNPPEWATYCTTFLFTWAIGSEGDMFPSHIGVPVGEDGEGDTYFKLEIHYNNPMRKTFMDNSGFRIFYTENLRNNDAGTLVLGHRITPFQMIPQFQNAFTTHSFCSSECTQNGISASDGIKITSGLLHAQMMGRKIMLRHVRKGQELEPILQDKNYDFTFQQFRRVKKEVTVLPGDELMVECTYDTERQEKLTFGGMSTSNEMCEAVVLYYPKTDLTDCRSQPEFHSFFQALGISNVSGTVFDKMRLPFTKYQPYFTRGSVQLTQVDNALQLMGTMESSLQTPFEMARGTMSSNSSSVGAFLRHINWNHAETVKGIENGWRNGLHYMFCSASGLRRIPIDENTLHYPKFEPYRQIRESDCRSESSERSLTSTTHKIDGAVVLLIVLTYLL